MKSKGANLINKSEHLNQAGAKKVIQIYAVPGRVIPIATDIAAAGVFVGKGNIIRFLPAAMTYIAFGAVNIGAVDINTTPALTLPAVNDFFIIVATDDYIRASLNGSRIEVIEEADFDWTVSF